MTVPFNLKSGLTLPSIESLLEVIISKMELHPEYEKYGYFGFDKVRPDNSEEYNQLVEEYNEVYKEWNECREGLVSKQSVLFLFIVLTIIWGIFKVVRSIKTHSDMHG